MEAEALLQSVFIVGNMLSNAALVVKAIAGWRKAADNVDPLSAATDQAGRGKIADQ